MYESIFLAERKTDMKLLYGTTSILSQKDFLSVEDINAEQLTDLLNLAEELKARMNKGYMDTPLKGKILGMIFEKNSTRTRVSFEAGMLQLGGHAIFLSGNDSQLGRGEPIADTAKVLSEYVDALMIRTTDHERADILAASSNVPVINGLTDLEHPCQALADLLTIKEEKGYLQGIKIAYVGDGNNVANSLMMAAVKSGMHIAIATPRGYEPNLDLVEKARAESVVTGGKIELFHNPEAAVSEADIIYSDVWTSMGQEKENEKRLADFKGFQVSEQLAASAKADYLFMHCLPAHRGEEVASSIIDSAHSIVIKQAGNRLHAQKALMLDLMLKPS